MQDQPRGGGDPRAMTVAERHAREECRVLREVLSIYPESLTLEELTRELTVAPPDEHCSEESVRIAVLELMGCGLLHRLGDLVLPTRPATVFYALVQDGEI
jgi:hypothetical protein